MNFIYKKILKIILFYYDRKINDYEENIFKYSTPCTFDIANKLCDKKRVLEEKRETYYILKSSLNEMLTSDKALKIGRW